MKSLSVTIQMKATEQYFPVVLFIMLYKVVLTMRGGLCHRISVKKQLDFHLFQSRPYLNILSLCFVVENI